MINTEQASTALNTLMQLSEERGNPLTILEARCEVPGCDVVHGIAIIVADAAMAAGVRNMFAGMLGGGK